MKNETENKRIQTEKHSGADLRFLNFVQHSGDSLFLFPLFLILYFSGNALIKEYTGLLLTGITITGIVVWILKNLIRKERPKGTNGKIYRKYDPFSFPSGHAARVCAIFTIIAFLNFRMAIVTAIWAGIIIYSRIKLKLHFISDTIVGCAVGIITGICTIWLGSLWGLYKF